MLTQERMDCGIDDDTRRMKMLLPGYLTYVVVGVTIAYAVVVEGIAKGDWNSAGLIILGALGLGTFKRGAQRNADAVVKAIENSGLGPQIRR